MDNKIIAGAAASLAIAMAIIFYLNFGLVEDVKTFDMQIQVKPNYGFNLDTDALRFGGAPPGSTAERGIEITNMKSYPMRVTFYAKGDIVGWLRSFDNDFIVPPSETMNMTFFVDIPTDASNGFYNGSLLIETRRAWF